jgi:spore coat polysaccharide biosynthesis protein SpsF
MASTRLPGKVLRLIGRLPLLGHVVGRLRRLRHAAVVVLATGTDPLDDAIEKWCMQENVRCFRGSEEDVLDRYHQCAQSLGLDQIVRLTADNPFSDTEELDRLIEQHLRDGNDLTHSFASLPVGVGAEIFNLASLARSHREGHAPHHREHVDEYMLENPALFRTGRLEVPAAKRRPDVRLTVDTDEDYRRACFIAEHATGEWADTEEAIALCTRFA